MSIIHGFVIFCLFARTLSHSQVWDAKGVPSCLKPETFSAFNRTKHMGTWYVNGRVDTSDMMKYDCHTEHWSAVQNGEITIVTNFVNEVLPGFTQDEFIKKNRSDIKEWWETARVYDSSKPERFHLCYADGKNFCPDYWIMDTDYISYSIQYFCETITVFDRFFFHEVKIMTRERDPPKDVIEKAMNFISQRGFDISTYKKTNHTECETLDKKSNEEEVDRNSVERENR